MSQSTMTPNVKTREPSKTVSASPSASCYIDTHLGRSCKDIYTSTDSASSSNSAQVTNDVRGYNSVQPQNTSKVTPRDSTTLRGGYDSIRPTSTANATPGDSTTLRGGYDSIRPMSTSNVTPGDNTTLRGGDIDQCCRCWEAFFCQDICWGW